MFQNSLFYILHPKMIVIEDALRILYVQIVFCELVPRHCEQGLQVVELRGIVGRMHAHALQFVNFALKHFGHIGAPFLVLGTLTESVCLGFCGVTQLLLDGMHLLLQVVFTLVLVDLFFGFFLDLLLDGKAFLFLIEESHQSDGAVLDVVGLQQFLPVIKRHGVIGSNKVDYHRRMIDLLDSHQGVLRDSFHHLEDTQRGPLDAGRKCGKLVGAHLVQILRLDRHIGLQIRTLAHDFAEANALNTLYNHELRILGYMYDSQHFSRHAHRIQVGRSRLVFGLLFLREDCQQGAIFIGFSDQFDRLGSADRDRHQHVGEKDFVAEWQQAQTRVFAHVVPQFCIIALKVLCC